MTKRDYRRGRRLAPLGEDGVVAMRRIVNDHAAAKVNEVFVDAFSASAFVQVYDKLNAANQAKLRGQCVGRAIDLVWGLVGRSQEAAS